MSTVLTLLAHEEATPPTLRRFQPRLVGREREYRKITVQPEIHEWLYGAKTEAQREYRAKVRVHFAQFVKGEMIDDCYFMKRIEDRRRAPWSMSHGIWAISPRFEPQHRFFGCFATLDWFLVLSKQDRDRLSKNEQRWHEQIDKCLRTWERLVPGYPIHVATDLAGFVSSNAEHCDDRWPHL
jgi:hypothetical protein